jgi:hypothetical protein
VCIRSSSVATESCPRAKSAKMAGGGLPPRLDPRRKPRDVVIVGDEPEGYFSPLLESDQEGPRLRDGESVLRSLTQNANERQIRDRAGKDFVACCLPETQQRECQGHNTRRNFWNRRTYRRGDGGTYRTAPNGGAIDDLEYQKK